MMPDENDKPAVQSPTQSWFGRPEKIELTIPVLTPARLAKLDQILDLIITALTPPPPAPPDGFSIKEQEMADKAAARVKLAGVDLQILENGTVKYTATPTVGGSTTDPATGNPVIMPPGTPPLTWTSSDPALTLASDPSDTSGFNLSQIGTAGATPTTGIVVTCQTTLAGAAAPITGEAAPVDIIPVPVTPSNPTGFAVAESQ